MTSRANGDGVVTFAPAATGRTLPRWLEVWLHPALLAAVLLGWAAFPDADATLPLTLVGVQAVLGLLEMRFPARPEWAIGQSEWGGRILAFVVLGAGIGLVEGIYHEFAAAPLASLRSAWHLDVWPHHWPAIVQIAMVFFGAELVWYWIHRAEHRFTWVWRASGHGAHHSFKRLGALNSGLNHPFEFGLLMLPTATIELLFGVGAPALGAAVLFATQASIAHANLTLAPPGIGWLLTTNRHHIHHHSVVLEESNTNYSCAAIVWDRLFGTFADADTRETGTGPSEPSMLEKLRMPFVEPADTATAPPRG